MKPLYPAVISDRNLEEACTTTQRRIESASTFHPKVREPLIFNLQKELALFQSIPNAPITVTHTSYINFTMNGVYYSYSLDNNPFFPFHYLKTPIDPKSETYSGDACVEESSKSWFTDPLIGFACTSDTETLKLLALTNKAISNILYRALQIADEDPTQLSL